MDGMSMDGKGQASGAATGGVLRDAVAVCATLQEQQAKQAFCGWSMRKLAPTAVRNTPPAAEAAPPSRRGAVACAQCIHRKPARRQLPGRPLHLIFPKNQQPTESPE